VDHGSVSQYTDTAIPMPDYVLDVVRSMDEVSYAVPLFIGGATLKLKSGTYVSVSVIGLDDFTLFGRPTLNRAASSTSTTIIRFWSFTTLNSRSLKTQDRHLIRA